MMVNTIYINCAQPLEPDDLILLFTDGIYEVFNATENEFGSEKLAAFLKTNRELPMDKLLDELLAEAKSFSATKSFDDDVCLIALEALPVI